MYWRLKRSITFLLFLGIGLALLLVAVSDNKSVYLVATSLIGLYWFYRTSIYGIFSFINFFHLKKLQNNPKQNPEHLHIFMIACYGESYEVLSESINSIFAQKYPKEKLYIFISLEERKRKVDSNYASYINQLQKDFITYLDKNLFITIHPADLPNEVAGAASNKSWCSKFAYEHLVSNGIDISNCIVTVPDADTIFDENYLIMLDHAISEVQDNKVVFFQPAVYKVLNNFSEQYFFTKSLGNTLTLSILGSSMLHNKYRYTFSCFSLYLTTLVEVDYWDTTESIDDTLFYWRLYNHYQKRPECISVYAGISVEGIKSKNILLTFKEQYNQFYRWGWGAQIVQESFQSAIRFNENKIKSLIEVLQIVDRFVLMRFTGILIMVAFALGRIYPNNFWSLIALICIAIFFFGNILQTMLLRESGIKESGLRKVRSFLIDTQLSIIFLVFFGFVPFLHAGLDMIIYKNSASKIKWSKKL